MIALRASPIPVAIGTVTKRFPACHSPSGSRPIERPFIDAAPSQAASMTPPLPPHNSTIPSAARPAPRANAACRSAKAASRGPMTATGIRHGLPLSICNHRTASRNPIDSPLGRSAAVQHRCGTDDRVLVKGIVIVIPGPGADQLDRGKGRNAARERGPYLGIEPVVFDLERRLIVIGIFRRRHAANRVAAFRPEPQARGIDRQWKAGGPLAAIDDIDRTPARPYRQI